MKPDYKKIGLSIIEAMHPSNDGCSCGYYKDRLWHLHSINDYPLQHGYGLDLYVHEDLLAYIDKLTKKTTHMDAEREGGL